MLNEKVTLILSAISIYPIKSLKGITLSESTVEKRGLRHDRRWMLTDRGGMFFTQREVPKMAAVTIAVDDGGLTASAEGVEAIRIPYKPAHGSRQRVTVWQSEVEGLVYNGIVSEWFSDVLGRACQLVLMPEDATRKVNPDFAVRPDGDVVSFADGYPFLLIGEGSLADLNSRLSRPVPMNRFRPNLVISGSDAFAEDTWRKIKIGDTIFHVVKPCARCVTTTVDQARGEFAGKEPLKTLATYRQTDGKVMFGQNLIAEMPGGTLRIGDQVEILETKD